MEVDRRYENCIVVVDAEAEGYYCAGDKSLERLYQKMINEVSRTLIQLNCLSEMATVVMMTERQAMEELSPDSCSAAPVAVPLAIIIHDDRADITNRFGARTENLLVERYYNNREVEVPTIPLMIRAIKDSCLYPLRDERDKQDFILELISGLAYQAKERRELSNRKWLTNDFFPR